LTGKTKSEIVTQALEEAGLFNEKDIEYFKSIIENKNDTGQGVQDEGGTTQTI